MRKKKMKKKRMTVGKENQKNKTNEETISSLFLSRVSGLDWSRLGLLCKQKLDRMFYL